MTRIVFLTALTALVGCKKDECDDTAAGACDTGAEEVEEEEEEEEEGDPAPTDSCTITADICVAAGSQTTKHGAGLGLTYSADSCATGYTGWCAIPAGGDYTACNWLLLQLIDGEGACTGAGVRTQLRLVCSIVLRQLRFRAQSF